MCEVADGICSHKCDYVLRELIPLVKIIGMTDIEIVISHDEITDSQSEKDARFFTWNFNLDHVKINILALHEEGFTPQEIVYFSAVHILTKQTFERSNTSLKDDYVNFKSAGWAEKTFLEFWSFISSCRKTNFVLPVWEKIGNNLIASKLFVRDTYDENTPRHLQFLYKATREILLPGSNTLVALEVDQLFTFFCNFLGSGHNLFEFSTRVSKNPLQEMSANQKFLIWTENIFPRWQDLKKLDKTDFFQANIFSLPTEGNAGQKSSDVSEGSWEVNEEKDGYPQDDMTEKSPSISLVKSASRKVGRPEHSYTSSNSFHYEVGSTSHEEQRYLHEATRFKDEIGQLCNHFKSLLNSDLNFKRKLRGGLQEGAFLSPERIVQTQLNIKSGIFPIDAFTDYSKKLSAKEENGNADYIFAFDRSGSMRGEKAAACASTAVICLEAMARIEDEFLNVQFTKGEDLNYSIRSAIYTFNDKISVPKPLSPGITLNNRLDTIYQVRNTSGPNSDSQLLKSILDIPRERSRKQTLFVVSDGEADNPGLAREYILQLRSVGWRIFGISIGSNAAVELYAPFSTRVDNPIELPQIMSQLIELALENA